MSYMSKQLMENYNLRLNSLKNSQNVTDLTQNYRVCLRIINDLKVRGYVTPNIINDMNNELVKEFRKIKFTLGGGL